MSLATTAPRTTTVPRVWGLLGHRRGDNQQVIALCSALSWPFELKQLHYGWASHVPNVLRRALPLGIRVDPQTPIQPPWPDLVIAVGRRSVPMALRIRAATADRCRLVQLGRPFAPFGWFDLIVTTPQYRLPAAANVLEIPLPFGTAVAAPAAGLAASIADLPRPRIAVLVGGPTREVGFAAAQARQLAALVNELVAAERGSLLVTTSPRTTPAIIEELRACLRQPNEIHVWSVGSPNPYGSYLATADSIVVTGDSVSMLADACRTGAPVRVFPLPPHREPSRRPISTLFAWLAQRAGRGDLPGRALAALQEAGVLVAPRAYDEVYRAVARRGLIADLSRPVATSASERKAAIAVWEREAVDRVKSLFPDR